jgi:hypothetical protein
MVDHSGMRFLATIALALALVPTSTASNGWVTHRATAGFSVSVPAAWVDVTRLTPQVLARVRENPTLKPYVDMVKRSSAIKLMLVDLGHNSVVDGYASNLNVIQSATVADLRLVHDAAAQQLRATGLVTGGLTVSYASLPAGKAVELQYRARFSTSTPEVSLRQYIFVRDGVQTVLTYTSLPKRAAANAAAFLRSARSFRWA